MSIIYSSGGLRHVAYLMLHLYFKVIKTNLTQNDVVLSNRKCLRLNCFIIPANANANENNNVTGNGFPPSPTSGKIHSISGHFHWLNGDPKIMGYTFVYTKLKLCKSPFCSIIAETWS